MSSQRRLRQRSVAFSPNNPWRSKLMLGFKIAAFLGWTALVAVLSPVIGDRLMRPVTEEAFVPPRLNPKFANGDDVFQEFKPIKEGGELPLGAADEITWAQVMAFLERHDPPATSPLRFTPRYAMQMKVADREGPARARKTLAKYIFNVSYHGVPLAGSSSKAVFIEGNRAVFLEERNLPRTFENVGEGNEEVQFQDAKQLGLADSQRVFQERYPTRNAILTTLLDEVERPHIEIYVDKNREAFLAWSYLIGSGDPSAPYTRRYWAAAKGEPRILDHEDLIVWGCSHLEPRPPFQDHTGFGGLYPLLAPSWQPPFSPKQGMASPRRSADRFENRLAYAAPIGHGMLPPPDTTVIIKGVVWKSSPFGPLKEVPLKNLVVTLQNGPRPITAITDEQGKCVFKGVTGEVIVNAELAGPYCNIINAKGALSQRKKGRGIVELSFPPDQAGHQDERQVAQVSAFYWVNESFDFIKPYLPPRRPKLLLNLQTKVNLPVWDGDRIGAFWDHNVWPRTINFTEGKKAPDESGKNQAFPCTAYREVILHEYGHALDDECGFDMEKGRKTGIHDWGYTEGLGDSLVVLYTHDPIIAPDWYGQGTKPLRDVREVFNWPDVRNYSNDGRQYAKGLAYAGFTWELTQELKAQYGARADAEAKAFGVAKELILRAASYDPLTIPDAVWLSFYFDAQLFPGTSGGKSLHFDALKKAAERRQLPVPPQPANLPPGYVKSIE